MVNLYPNDYYYGRGYRPAPYYGYGTDPRRMQQLQWRRAVEAERRRRAAAITAAEEERRRRAIYERALARESMLGEEEEEEQRRRERSALERRWRDEERRRILERRAQLERQKELELEKRLNSEESGRDLKVPLGSEGATQKEHDGGDFGPESPELMIHDGAVKVQPVEITNRDEGNALENSSGDGSSRKKKKSETEKNDWNSKEQTLEKSAAMEEATRAKFEGNSKKNQFPHGLIEGVEDASDDEEDNLKSVWRNRIPSEGQWMEPVEGYDVYY